MRVVSFDEFAGDSFSGRWSSLLGRCGLHDLGQTFAWNSTWWSCYERSGAGKKELFLLVQETNGNLDSIWPFFIRHRHGVRVLHWIGQVEGMITDYMLPVVPLANQENAIRKVMEFLAEHSSRWDVADLTLPAWADQLSSLVRTAIVHGSKAGLSWKTAIADHSAAVALPDSFDTYLSSLGSKTRSHLKQYLRAAEKADAKLEVQVGAEIQDNLSELFRLNGGRWDVFSKDTARDFLKKTVHRAAADGSARLVSLRCDGERIASALCYHNQRTLFVHSAGVVRKSVAGFSPGTVMYAMLTRSLIEEGCNRLDFSPGLEEYKLRLGANVEPVFRFVLWHHRSRLKRWNLLSQVRSAKNFAARAKSLLHPRFTSESEDGHSSAR